jgi:hypothetical protein
MTVLSISIAVRTSDLTANAEYSLCPVKHHAHDGREEA